MLNQFSFEALEEWLKTKDPDEEYSWIHSNNCLWGQYAKSLGLSYIEVMEAFRARGLVSKNGGEPGFGIGIRTPNTFGAALERTRKSIKGWKKFKELENA